MKLKATGADLRLAQLLFVVCICNMQRLDHSDCSLCNGEPIQLWSYWPPLIVYVHGSSGAYSAAVDNCPWLLDAAASCHIQVWPTQQLLTTVIALLDAAA
jgi:hypothetical protein